jgi:hypothetical protein
MSREHKSIYFPDDALWREAGQLARARGQSVSGVVHNLLTRWVVSERVSQQQAKPVAA